MFLCFILLLMFSLKYYQRRIPNAYRIEIMNGCGTIVTTMPATIRRRTMVRIQIRSLLAVIVILHCLWIIVIYRRHPAAGIIEISLRPNFPRIVATLNRNTIHKLTADGNVPRKKNEIGLIIEKEHQHPHRNKTLRWFLIKFCSIK